MKKLRWILPFILLSFFAKAGQVSGYISLKWIGGYTYQINVTDYTNGDPQNSSFCDPYDVDTLRLYILDGGLQSILLTRTNGKGDSVCTCRKANLYTTTYTFSGPAQYRIWFDGGSRAPNINNIPNSSLQDMQIYNALTIQSPIKGDTSFPVITNPPLCTYACPTQCYHFNLNAYSSAGDSLSYSLGNCLQSNGEAIGYYNPGAIINDSGTLKWCPSAKDSGLWNFAIRIVTYNRIITFGNPIQAPVDTEEVELQVDVQNNCTLGVNEVKDASEKIEVYPNPSSGLFMFVIASEAKQSLSTISIYNVLGQNVFTETLRSAQGDNNIDLTNQPNGIYFYRVLNENGSLIGDGKLMVEH